MEEDFDATNVLVSDSFKEASEGVCKRFPRYSSRVIYEGTPIEKHFYVDESEVPEDEYNHVVRLTASCNEARQIALDEAKLEILMDNEKRMEDCNYIIKLLKHGPKSQYEVEKNSLSLVRFTEIHFILV